MATVRIVSAHVVLKDFGAAVIICDWEKDRGYVVGALYEQFGMMNWVKTPKTYAKLSAALRQCAKLVGNR